jgi:membrane-associated phospholipid phosphatase
MDFKPPIDNAYLFGNIILETIPHPDNIIGLLLNILTIICHYAGGISFWVVALPLAYLFLDRKFSIKVALALFSTGIINGLLKFYFQSPRPFGLSSQFQEIQKYVSESSFGVPSGHAHVSILVWGIVFLDFQNKWIKAIALFFMIFTPFSRLYAGVHYPGDVLLGFTCGAISLVLIQKLFHRIPDFPNPSSWERPEQTVKWSIQSAIVLTLPVILIQPNTIQHAHSIDSVISASGSLVGCISGLLTLKQYFPLYSREKSGLVNPIVSLLLLISGIIFLYVLLGHVGKTYLNDNSLFKYFRYAILNFYIIFFIPFLTLRISGQKNH